MSDGTIYNSFENKDALLLAILDPMDDAGRAEQRPLADPRDASTFIRDMLQRRLAALTPDALRVLRVVLSEAMTNAALRQRFMDRVIAPALLLPAPHFRKLVADGRLRAIDVPMMLRAITASFLGLVMLRLLTEDSSETWAAEAADLLCDVLLQGLLPREDAHDQT